jgi:alpha-ketoglutarate-dependent 2,4-dichlorophenoxyacetate dioxygenase
MAVTVTVLHPCLGARVEGVDLTQPVPPNVLAEIEAAINRHAVLVFPNQPLTDEQQIGFSNLFGPLEIAPFFVGEKRRRLQHRELEDISNLDPDGNVLALNDLRRLYNLGNQLWHTDSSFKYHPARFSLLSARAIPPEGGETEFADMRAAYDALPDEKKRQLEGLTAEHSIFVSRHRIGFTEFNEDVARALPPVPQVMVRTHAGSGRKSLYLASHASHIIGWPQEQGSRLIEELIEFATQPQFVYQHQWRVGDLVMWDNRCTMHRGRPYDEAKYRRDMHRTTVSDEMNSVERERGAQSAA